MVYRGFNEGKLLSAAKEFEALGLSPQQVYPLMNAAGAKWRSIQVREKRNEESQDRAIMTVLQKVAAGFMQATMTANQELARLGHAEEVEKYLLLAVGIAYNELLTSGPSVVKRWIKAGDAERRKYVLAFALGSCILIEAEAADQMVLRMVRARYAPSFDSGSGLAEALASAIDRLATSGYAILLPVLDPLT